MNKGVSRNSWIILKQVWNMAGNDNSNWAECGNVSFEGYKSFLQRYFGIGSWDEDQAIYCLTAKYNADYNEGAGDSPNPFENIGPDEVLIPKIYKYVIEHNKDEYETEYYQDECRDDGTSEEYEEDCECEYATTEKYFEESGEFEEEECEFDYDDDCECQSWKEPEIELYWWTIEKSTYFSLEDDHMSSGCEGEVYCIHDATGAILMEREEEDDGYGDRQTWDYFADSDNGYVHDWDMEDTEWEVEECLKGEPQ
tara:strand:- start:743 stop:1504 length:762 start_codon:yes stop_codon:yes gene_type:complete